MDRRRKPEPLLLDERDYRLPAHDNVRKHRREHESERPTYLQPVK